MHSLTIVFGPAATTWTLLFKEEAKAAAIYNDWTSGKMAADLPLRTFIEQREAGTLVDSVGGALIAADDFGQALSLGRSSIHGMMLEDMDLSQQAAIERGLHQARTQGKAQSKAMDDPIIKDSLRKQQQGPAVYQPGMPNGGMRMM